MSQVSQGSTVFVDGRIVWTVGELFKGKIKTDQQTRQPVLNQAGEQIREYGFGLAVPKNMLSQPAPVNGGPNVWQVMHTEAIAMFPNGGGQIPPSFAMKYKDGDTSVDESGQSYSTRKGYPGCIVLSCTTRLPIKFFKWENGGNVQIPEGIKCGDYVRVQLQVKAHPALGQGKAGLYLNPSAVQLVAFGEEIINRPSGDQIFGLGAPPIPPGGSATPTAPAAFPGMPAAPGQQMAPPQAPPVYQAPAPAAPSPHHAVLPPQFQPPPGGMPVAPQAPPAPAYNAPPMNNYAAPPVGNAPAGTNPMYPAGTYPAPVAPTTPTDPSMANPYGAPGAPPVQQGYWPPQNFQGGHNPQQPAAPGMPSIPGQPTYPQR
jgi:hypothetical protein